jgi:glyoxylase-like metal-dependent hydrolase (beta-lactamase superfamily II)
MKKYEFNKIDDNFYSIEQDGVRSFMIIGEYVLLIDSGRGGNNLLGQVRNYSDKPIKIVYTHADGDHTGDASDFTNRFMHPSEFDYFHSKSERPIPMNPVWEGEVIEVDNYKFEVILIPGHTPGSIALLEREKRFLIGGDSLQPGPIYMFGQGRNFYAFKSSMIKLQQYLDKFDYIYASHHQLKVPSNIINQLLEGADKMIKGEVLGTPEPKFEGKAKLYEVDGVAFFAK